MGTALSIGESLPDKEVESMYRIVASKRDELLALARVDHNQMVTKFAAGTSMGNRFCSVGELTGGRTLVRQEEVRIFRNDGAPQAVQRAVQSTVRDFFDRMQCGSGAKYKQVAAATHALLTTLSPIFTCEEGQEREHSGFVIVFMNLSFVRIDYHAYAYCHKGERWDAPGAISGACYVADLAVLDPAEMNSGETDYLLAQAFANSPPLPPPVSRRQTQQRQQQPVAVGAAAAAAAASSGDDASATTTAQRESAAEQQEQERDAEQAEQRGEREAYLRAVRAAEMRDAQIVSQMKAMLTFNVLLTKQIRRPNVSITELSEIMRKVNDTTGEMRRLFDQLSDC